MAKPYFAAIMFGVTTLVTGCGGGGEPAGNGTAVEKTSGDQQQGRVGEILADPIQVSVTTNGAAAAGVTVNWSTAAAGGALVPTSAVTDANGTASTIWTLGTTSGAQTATATVSGATGSPLTFNASAVAGDATGLEEAGGNGQTGEINVSLTDPVQAKVTDQFGNGVAGVDVNWSATGAAVSAPTIPTDAGGISGVTVTLGGAAGPITITAAADGLEGSPLTFTATAVEAAPIPTTASVTVRNDNFFSVHNSTANPAVDTVAAGGSVTWSWAPTALHQHNITPTGSPSFTGRTTVTPPPLPDPYTVNFPGAGTYNYYCTIHGTPTSGMRGRIVVR
jgi:plastocyanin